MTIAERAASESGEAKTGLDLTMRSVRWGVTVPTGNYSSARLDAEAFVVRDDADEVLAELKSWVGARVPPSVLEIEDLMERGRRLAQQNEQLAHRLVAAQEAYEKVLVVFTRLGLSMPEDVTEDLPF